MNYKMTCRVLGMILCCLAALLVLPGQEQAWTFEPFTVTWDGEMPDSTRTLSPVLKATDSTLPNILPEPTPTPAAKAARPGQQVRRGVPSASGSTLPQTGRNAWAVPALTGAGLLLVLAGLLLFTVGKRHE